MLTFLVITLGMAIGFAYVFVPWFRTTMAPVADLILAARPLLIPVLVLVAAATVNLPVWVQGLAAILLVLIVHRVVVRPELERESDELGEWWHAIEHSAVNAVRKFALVGVAGVAAAWVLLVVLPSQLLAGQGGLAAAALLVALIAVPAALVVRLIAYAYATTPPRIVVSLLLVLAAGAGLLALGVVVNAPWAASWAKWFVIAAAVTLVGTIVFEALNPPPDRSESAKKRAEQFLGLGLSLAMLSGILLVAATASSLWVLNHPDVTPLHADRGAHKTLYALGTDSLEYKYAPVLAFTHDQKWTPIKVAGHLQGARVVRKDGSDAPPGEYKCSSLGPRSCLQIRPDCATAEACAKLLAPHKPGDHVNDGAVYVRTLRRPLVDDTSDDAVALRGVFHPFTQVARDTDVLLQYWLFYRYDEWTTKVLGARLTQRHEGDWEAVTVGLDTHEKPLFVAYSAHCGGTWEHWAKTERFDSHPLVAVANGSQANYAETGATRPPDFTSCKRLPRGIGTLLGFAANVRDVTSDDWQWGAAEVVPVTEKKWPMNFPGTWGGQDLTEFKNHHSFKSGLGGGPKSPPLQALWQEPMKTIFCDRYWDGPEQCRKR